jgi:hypothetical protein
VMHDFQVLNTYNVYDYMRSLQTIAVTKGNILDRIRVSCRNRKSENWGGMHDIREKMYPTHKKFLEIGGRLPPKIAGNFL